MDLRVVVVVATRPLWLSLCLLLFGSSCAWAQGSGATRYISDETAITLREDKGMNSPVAALLKSGTKVELIEEDASSGYSRVRVAPGREGWVLARYLSNEPAARERLAAVQSELAEQKAAVRKLESDNARLRETAAAARSGASASASGEQTPENEPAASAAKSETAAMVTGAGLFVAGLLAGMLIPLVLRPKQRRRWSADL
jgi:SH3 domain protein